MGTRAYYCSFTSFLARPSAAPYEEISLITAPLFAARAYVIAVDLLERTKLVWHGGSFQVTAIREPGEELHLIRRQLTIDDRPSKPSSIVYFTTKLVGTTTARASGL